LHPWEGHSVAQAVGIILQNCSKHTHEDADVARHWLLLVVCCSLLKPSTLIAADADSAELVKLAIGLFREPDKDLRALGFDQVRTDAKGEAATRAFAAELPKLIPEAQVGLLSALADRGDAAAKPEVLKLFAAKGEEPVKVAAVAALGKLGNADDVALLVAQLSKDSKNLTTAARASLTTLPGDKSSAAIAAALKSAPPELSVSLIEILAARRALDTMPALLEAAVSNVATVRQAAMLALGQLGSPAQIAGLAAGVLKAELGEERVAAEKALVSAAARVEDQEQRAKPLLTVLESAKEADRLALLPTLGRLGGATALKLIQAELAQTDSFHHAAGVEALGNWPNASVFDDVYEIATKDTCLDCRETALGSLIRLAPMTDGRPNDVRLAATKKVMDLCKSDEDQNKLLRRIQNIRAVETLAYAVTYLDKPANAQAACEAIVEMAHHRGLREPNKPVFDAALDRVIATSKDPVVIDRAQRYKKDQTWVRPKAGDQ
jgi:HEAT repeat protein